MLLPELPARAQAKVCLSPSTTIARWRHTKVGEVSAIPLTHCNGMPNMAALIELSILGRPKSVKRPTSKQLVDFQTRASAKQRARYAAPGIVLLHPGLMVRMQVIANRWPGRPIHIVSGHRPTAEWTSRHRVGLAMDLRVIGVHRQHVSTFVRGLPATGVGFYPNSSFTHVDVRERSAYWIDVSGPGQEARYVSERRFRRRGPANLNQLMHGLLSGAAHTLKR